MTTASLQLLCAAPAHHNSLLRFGIEKTIGESQIWKHLEKAFPASVTISHHAEKVAGNRVFFPKSSVSLGGKTR
jgi:hypothetical protein